MTLIRTRSVHALGGPRVELGVWVILPGWAAHSRTKLGCPTRTDCDAVKNVWLWILGAFGFWPRFRAPGSLSATSCMWRHPNCGENPSILVRPNPTDCELKKGVNQPSTSISKMSVSMCLVGCGIGEAQSPFAECQQPSLPVQAQGLIEESGSGLGQRPVP